MPIFPRRQIENSLLKKGFRLKEGNHRFYYFYFKGKKTIIRTKISTGSEYKDYDDFLLHKIRLQLKFENKKQLADFIYCML